MNRYLYSIKYKTINNAKLVMSMDGNCNDTDVPCK